MPTCKHPDRKEKAKGLCGSCYNAHLLGRDPDVKAKILATKREQWALRYASRNSSEHAEKQKNRTLRHRYRIDLAEYQRMHAQQQNRCAICNAVGGDTRATRLYVDHNHATGAVRQLLCPGCNQALGIVEQGVERIASLAGYLAKHDPTSKVWNAIVRLDLILLEKK